MLSNKCYFSLCSTLLCVWWLCIYTISIFSCCSCFWVYFSLCFVFFVLIFFLRRFISSLSFPSDPLRKISICIPDCYLYFANLCLCCCILPHKFRPYFLDMSPLFAEELRSFYFTAQWFQLFRFGSLWKSLHLDSVTSPNYYFGPSYMAKLYIFPCALQNGCHRLFCFHVW